MILICYDGSDAARFAISQAGHLMPGHPAVVLTVWEPRLVLLDAATAGAGPHHPDESRVIAQSCAEEGTAAAHQAGIDALAESIDEPTSVAEAIIASANRLSADAIIIGSRHQRGVMSHLLGSVTRSLMQLADRPLLIVPSPDAPH